jgi:hypothetical protein
MHCIFSVIRLVVVHLYVSVINEYQDQCFMQNDEESVWKILCSIGVHLSTLDNREL